jgi:hypothetical protein
MNQSEGPAVFGTSLALMSEITATNGVIDQSNYSDCQVCHMEDVPERQWLGVTEDFNRLKSRIYNDAAVAAARQVLFKRLSERGVQVAV